MRDGVRSEAAASSRKMSTLIVLTQDTANQSQEKKMSQGGRSFLEQASTSEPRMHSEFVSRTVSICWVYVY